MTSESEPPDTPDYFEDDLMSNIDNMSNVDTPSIGSFGDNYDAMSPGSVSQTPMNKKRKLNETNDILREFLSSRPKPSDFVPQKPNDDVQQFFDSMASTVRKFSPVSIARIKMKIGQIVGEEEVAWAEAQSNVQYIYMNASTTTSNETTTTETLTFVQSHSSDVSGSVMVPVQPMEHEENANQ